MSFLYLKNINWVPITYKAKSEFLKTWLTKCLAIWLHLILPTSSFDTLPYPLPLFSKLTELLAIAKQQHTLFHNPGPWLMLFTLPGLPALSFPSGKFLFISIAHEPVTSLLMTSLNHPELVTSVFP